MTSLKHSLLLIAVVLSLSASAQRDDVNKLAVMKARGETSLKVGQVHYDMVVAENADPALEGMTLLRTARETPDGWAARVYAPDGTLLMEGTFADPGLHIPQGQFTFFHPNGEPESKGEFCKGSKVGDWLRWDQRGQPLVNHEYSTLCPTDTTGQHCWSSLSCKP